MACWPGRSVALLALLVTAPASLAAQEQSVAREQETDQAKETLAPGDTVRVESDGQRVRVEGTLLSLEPDTLRVDASAGPYSIALDSITRLDVRRGETSAIASGALIGALVGLGLTAAFLAGLSDDSPVSGGDFFLSALIIVPIPAIIGSVIGSAHRKPRWKQVPLESLHVGAGVTSHGALAIEATIRL